MGIKWTLSEKQNKEKSERMKGKIPKNLELLHTLPRTEKWNRKIGIANSISLKGKPGHSKGKHWKIKDTSKMKGKIGEFHWNWKGGISSENDKLRHKKEANVWKKACLERDNFICQKYKISGGRLVIHHINNFSQYPELRIAIDNGITLSEKAHIEFHKIYGKQNNTREQLNEFIYA